MNTVYKYPLTWATEQFALLPKGAEVLTAMVQDDAMTLWALVDTDAPLTERYFQIYGTGHTISEAPDDMAYISTVRMQTAGTELIWHVFEVLTS